MNFPLLDESTASQDAQEALAPTRKNFGMIPNVEKVMALVPQLLSGYAHMWDLFETTTFTAIERQVVYMTANFENECNYCVPWHSMLAKKAGMEPSEVDALRSGAPLADPKLEALRGFTAHSLPIGVRSRWQICKCSSAMGTLTCRPWR